MFYHLDKFEMKELGEQLDACGIKSINYDDKKDRYRFEHFKTDEKNDKRTIVKFFKGADIV